MKIHRRQFLKGAALSLGAASLLNRSAMAAATTAPGQTSFLRQPPKMKLGTVTYNLAKDWDIATIIKNCAEAKFQGVELRTTHAHGVEVSLSKQQRAEVKKRFQDSPVELMG
jgi:hypothetical protein